MGDGGEVRTDCWGNWCGENKHKNLPQGTRSYLGLGFNPIQNNPKMQDLLDGALVGGGSLRPRMSSLVEVGFLKLKSQLA